MIEKQLRKVQITNMALWIFALVFPMVARAFASKDPKIFDILFPMFHLMLAGTSTWMFASLVQSVKGSAQNDSESK
jgi:uncharacterized membrane protein